MTKQQRNKSLTELIGGKLAKEKREDLQKAAELLDDAGVERKARKSKSITLKEVDLMVVAETIGARVLKTLEEHGVTLAAAESNEADVQEPKQVTELVIEAVMDGVEEIAAEAEEGQDEEEEPEEEEEIKALTQTIKSLTDVVAQSLEDQGDMSKAIVLLAEAVPTITERLEALEKAYGHRPRQASKALETALEDEDGKIAAETKKSIEGEPIFLGRFRVSEEPE